MTSKTKRQQLFFMWKRNPSCHWCGRDTMLVLRTEAHPHNKVPPRDDEATIDHLRSRFDPTRQEPNLNHEFRRVLACWRCNNERSRAEQAQRPLEELHRRSGRGVFAVSTEAHHGH